MIRDRLQQFTGSLREVARRSGVGHSTIVDIKNGKIANPGILTVQAIEEALDSIEKPSPDSESQAPSAVGVGS
jgi:transcriptional regulator with XRE-family HTH domain